MSCSKPAPSLVARLPAAVAMVVLTMCFGLLGGCSAQSLLSVLFEQPPPGKASPQPVVRKPRHPPPQKPAEVAEIEQADLPPPIDWRAQFDALPRGSEGVVDWEQALSQKLVSPKPGADPEAKQEDVLDLDLEFVPKDQPEMKVVFAHKIHTRWLACANCHTAIFEMERSAQHMTMDQIMAGEKCGYCHGKVAFPATACPTCHMALK
jgi:c(7)-type cytochrome triheme protein